MLCGVLCIYLPKTPHMANKKRIEIRMTDVPEDLHQALTEAGSPEKRGPGKEALHFLEKNYPIKKTKKKK